jgi:hypothetical protein
MKITVTNRGSKGVKLWISDSGLTILHSNENNIECCSISHDTRSPMMEEIAEVRKVLLSEVKTYAITFGPVKKMKKSFNSINLIEYRT